MCPGVSPVSTVTVTVCVWRIACKLYTAVTLLQSRLYLAVELRGGYMPWSAVARSSCALVRRHAPPYAAAVAVRRRSAMYFFADFWMARAPPITQHAERRWAWNCTKERAVALRV